MAVNQKDKLRSEPLNRYDPDVLIREEAAFLAKSFSFPDLQDPFQKNYYAKPAGEQSHDKLDLATLNKVLNLDQQAKLHQQMLTKLQQEWTNTTQNLHNIEKLLAQILANQEALLAKHALVTNSNSIVADDSTKPNGEQEPKKPKTPPISYQEPSFVVSPAEVSIEIPNGSKLSDSKETPLVTQTTSSYQKAAADQVAWQETVFVGQTEDDKHLPTTDAFASTDLSWDFNNTSSSLPETVNSFDSSLSANLATEFVTGTTAFANQPTEWDEQDFVQSSFVGDLAAIQTTTQDATTATASLASQLQDLQQAFANYQTQLANLQSNVTAVQTQTQTELANYFAKLQAQIDDQEISLTNLNQQLDLYNQTEPKTNNKEVSKLTNQQLANIQQDLALIKLDHQYFQQLLAKLQSEPKSNIQPVVQSPASTSFDNVTPATFVTATDEALPSEPHLPTKQTNQDDSEHLTKWLKHLQYVVDQQNNTIATLEAKATTFTTNQNYNYDQFDKINAQLNAQATTLHNETAKLAYWEKELQTFSADLAELKKKLPNQAGNTPALDLPASLHQKLTELANQLADLNQIQTKTAKQLRTTQEKEEQNSADLADLQHEMSGLKAAFEQHSNTVRYGFENVEHKTNLLGLTVQKLSSEALQSEPTTAAIPSENHFSPDVLTQSALTKKLHTLQSLLEEQSLHLKQLDQDFTIFQSKFADHVKTPGTNTLLDVSAEQKLQQMQAAWEQKWQAQTAACEHLQTQITSLTDQLTQDNSVSLEASIERLADSQKDWLGGEEVFERINKLEEGHQRNYYAIDELEFRQALFDRKIDDYNKSVEELETLVNKTVERTTLLQDELISFQTAYHLKNKEIAFEHEGLASKIRTLQNEFSNQINKAFDSVIFEKALQTKLEQLLAVNNNAVGQAFTTKIDALWDAVNKLQTKEQVSGDDNGSEWIKTLVQSSAFNALVQQKTEAFVEHKLHLINAHLDALVEQIQTEITIWNEQNFDSLLLDRMEKCHNRAKNSTLNQIYEQLKNSTNELQKCQANVLHTQKELASLATTVALLKKGLQQNQSNATDLTPTLTTQLQALETKLVTIQNQFNEQLNLITQQTQQTVQKWTEQLALDNQKQLSDELLQAVKQAVVAEVQKAVANTNWPKVEYTAPNSQNDFFVKRIQDILQNLSQQNEDLLQTSLQVKMADLSQDFPNETNDNFDWFYQQEYDTFQSNKKASQESQTSANQSEQPEKEPKPRQE